jgi:hypothetical protein
MYVHLVPPGRLASPKLLPVMPFLYPSFDPPNFPFMRCSNVIRLCFQIQNPVAIPMVAPTRYEVLILSIAQWGIVTVIAYILPDVHISINECQSWS